MQLKEFIKSLPQGLDSFFPEGKQLSSSNAQKLLLARSIIRPKILFYEDPTDNMDDKVANEIIDFITAKEHQWTIIVSSKISTGRASVTEILL
jgi:ABC-type multidrug transport system fused ATPase/permease subunit